MPPITTATLADVANDAVDGIPNGNVIGTSYSYIKPKFGPAWSAATVTYTDPVSPTKLTANPAIDAVGDTTLDVIA